MIDFMNFRIWFSSVAAIQGRQGRLCLPNGICELAKRLILNNITLLWVREKYLELMLSICHSHSEHFISTKLENWKYDQIMLAFVLFSLIVKLHSENTSIFI